MKKMALCMILCIMILSMTNLVFSEERISVVLNDEEIIFDVPPMIMNDRTIVPVRAILEALDLNVEWIGETRTVIASGENKRIELQIDNPNATVDGEHVILDQPAVIVNDRTLVPVRFIAESTGALVDWEGITKTVIITTNKGIDNKIENPYDLKVQGYSVPNKDYIVHSKMNYDIKSDVFETVGLEYPAEIVVDGYINIHDFINSYPDKKIGWGYSGDEILILNVDGEQRYEGNADSTSELERQIVVSDTSLEEYLGLIDYFSSTGFKGKGTGSDELKEVAFLLEKEFKIRQIEVESFSYHTNVRDILKTELAINGQSLELMEDYMPFSRSGDDTFSGSLDAIYVKDGTQLSGLNLSGKTVIFSWYDSEGQFNKGITDRIMDIRSQGAKNVFIIEGRGELEVGYYEHPVNANNVGIYAQYISEEIADELGITDYSEVYEFEIELEYSFKTSAKNVTTPGMISTVEGASKETLMFITNIDGFGTLPDGYAYENTAYSVVSPVTFLALADYYSVHQPYYTMKFAFLSDKWTLNDGSSALLNHISNNDIDVLVDVYALGGIGDNTKMYNAKESRDLGNALSSKLPSSNIDNYIIRGSNSTIRESHIDTYDNYNKALFDIELSGIIEFIDELDGDYETKTDLYTFTEIEKHQVNRSYQFAETKYLNIYSDEDIDETKLHEFDTVVRNIMRVNYYNSYNTDIDKFDVYISNDHQSAAIIGGRRDLIGNYTAGGGFASHVGVENPMIYLRSIQSGILAHEFNHILAHDISKKQYLYEEGQGKTLLFGNGYVSAECMNRDFDRDKYPVIRIDEGNKYYHLLPDIAEDINNNKGIFSWSYITKPETCSYGPGVVENIIASFYSFIIDEYGYNTGRRVTYQVFENPDDFRGIIEEATMLEGSIFLKAWAKWYLSDGEEKITVINLDEYEDNLTEDDYRFIDLLE